MQIEEHIAVKSEKKNTNLKNRENVQSKNILLWPKFEK